MPHSFFESNMVQYSMVNGKKSGQEKHVTIINGKGKKEIKKMENGNVVSNVSVPLTSEELENVQKNIFIPKFWENCNPGNVACTIRNKSASKRKTRKHRRH
jgi:hypothetical protein